MSYAGICAKYGMGKALGVSMAGPFALNTALQFAKASSPESIILTGISSTMFGFLSFGLAAIVSHLVVENLIEKRGIGITRGSKLLRGWQAAIYALPLAAGLTLNTMSDIHLGTPQTAQYTQKSPVQNPAFSNGNYYISMG